LIYLEPIHIDDIASEDPKVVEIFDDDEEDEDHDLEKSNGTDPSADIAALNADIAALSADIAAINDNPSADIANPTTLALVLSPITRNNFSIIYKPLTLKKIEKKVTYKKRVQPRLAKTDFTMLQEVKLKLSQVVMEAKDCLDNLDVFVEKNLAPYRSLDITST